MADDLTTVADLAEWWTSNYHPDRPGVLHGQHRLLTVLQPYAWAIAEGHKTVENRPWRLSTMHGPVLIHAGQSRRNIKLGRRVIADLHGLDIPPDEDLPLGAVIALALLSGACGNARIDAECGCGPWAMPKRHHWRFRHVLRLRQPVPARGQQGLFPVSDGLVRAVYEQLGPT